MGFLDSVESIAGQVINVNAHMAGGVLDAIGLDEAGHEVDKWGDGIADDLGAGVGELNLGESDDPKELVHGDVHAIGDTVAHLRKFATAFEETGAGLSRMDSDHWQGKAADAFRQKFSTQPTAWRVTADACEAAAKALEALASTISWAQGQAQQAIDTYNMARRVSKAAQDVHDRQVDDFNHAVNAYNQASAAGQNPTPPTKPAEFHDPGAEGLKHAAEMLLAARKQRVDVAHTAEQAIKAATSNAPKEPGLMARLGMDVMDVQSQAAVGLVHFQAGLVKGGADLLKFGRGLNPLDVYNITHPAMFLDHLVSVGTGLIHTENHPTELLSAVAGSGWGSDPAEAGGKAVFNLISGVATGGGSEAGAVAERLAVDAAEQAAADAAERAVVRETATGGEASFDGAFKPEDGPWQPDTRANYPAYHSGSVSPEEAKALIDHEFPWMNDINKPRWADDQPGYNTNCTNNVATVDRRLDGIEADTAPLRGGRGLPETESLYQKVFDNPEAEFRQVDGYDRISEDIAARGPGARGAVVIFRSDSAHVFNVINSDGRVIYLDGQTGGLAKLETADIKDLRYMPYR